jgi:hypothetical protein
LKDIHVFLTNYSIPSDLKKALNSLNYIFPRLNKVTVFNNHYPYLYRSDSYLQVNREYVDTQQDLGATLNSYVQTVESEYILFLFKSDLLLSEVKDLPLTLKDNESIMTIQFESSQFYQQLPFMVRTSFLKKSPFLLEREVPFKEVIFHLWYIKNFDSGIMELNGKILGETRKK